MILYLNMGSILDYLILLFYDKVGTIYCWSWLEESHTPFGVTSLVNKSHRCLLNFLINLFGNVILETKVAFESSLIWQNTKISHADLFTLFERDIN